MALVKCPRCELNYMQDTDRYCSVCRREMRGEDEREELEICSECGEHPVVPGEEFCSFCLKEMTRQERAMAEEDEPVVTEEVGELDAASNMDEIDIANDQDIPSDEFHEINRELEMRGEDADAEDVEDEGTQSAEEEDFLEEELVGFCNFEDDMDDDDQEDV